MNEAENFSVRSTRRAASDSFEKGRRILAKQKEHYKLRWFFYREKESVLRGGSEIIRVFYNVELFLTVVRRNCTACP